jgi:hypothetical protein
MFKHYLNFCAATNYVLQQIVPLFDFGHFKNQKPFIRLRVYFKKLFDN